MSCVNLRKLACERHPAEPLTFPDVDKVRVVAKLKTFDLIARLLDRFQRDHANVRTLKRPVLAKQV